MQQEIPALATLDAGIIVTFLLGVTLVGWAMSKRASQGLDDYFLGGKTIPWWILGISTATSNFDMSGTMMIVAVVFGLGYKGFLVELRGGVGLTLTFLMVFLGKWLRRSRVMTSAEWMKLRFGTDKQGKAAHLLSAIANIVLSVGMIIYFSKGAGKFLTNYIPLSELTCTTLMVGIGLFYTLLSGLYGVVFTDVLQMLLLGFTAVYVTVKAFLLRPAVEIPAALFALDLKNPAAGVGESLRAANAAAWDPIFSAFALCVGMWLVRTFLEGWGGVGGYTDQRFFAARTEREASLLTMESVALSVLRWTMVAGLVVMGYELLGRGGELALVISRDAEQVLPLVLQALFPVGLKGLVLAGLIAAAMSTFDSTLNAGAAYIVKDLYASYVNPAADGRALMRVSRWATIALCVAGVGLAAVVPNINQIWGLITMGLGAGMFVPLFLRWYWPRFNGYGFAAGTAVGVVAALAFNAALSWPLYQAFPTIVLSSLAASLLVTLLSAPTDDGILASFWVQVGPWGHWGRIAEIARVSGAFDQEQFDKRRVEHRRDLIAMLFAIPFHLSMLITSMATVFHDWDKVQLYGMLSAIGAVGIYLFWYRNLKSDAECRAEDAAIAGSAAQSFGPP